MLLAVFQGVGLPLLALAFGNMSNVLTTGVRHGLKEPTLSASWPSNRSVSQKDDVSLDEFKTHLATALSSNAVSRPMTEEPLDAADFDKTMNLYSQCTLCSTLPCTLLILQYMAQQVSCERIIERIKNLFSNILRQELSWFDKHQSGALASLLNDNIEQIKDGIGIEIARAVKSTAGVLIGFGLGLKISWKLTLVVLVATPFLNFSSFFVGKLVIKSSFREQSKYADAAAIAEEVLVGIRIVFSLSGQRREYKAQKMREAKQIGLRKTFIMGAVIGLGLFAMNVTYGVALYVAAILVRDGDITTGAALTVIFSALFGSSALGGVIPPTQAILSATGSATTIYYIIDSKPKIDAKSNIGVQLTKLTSNIRFDKVSFSYPTGPTLPVIKNLNLELREGQTVAICGKT